MRHKFLTAALSLTTILSSGAAFADQALPSWYLGLTGSVAFLRNSSVNGNGAGINTGLTYQTGWGAGASLGYQPTETPMLQDMHFEGEVFYHINDLDTRRTTGGEVDASNSISAVSYMANAYYTLPTHWELKPYIGAGLGATTVTLSTNSGIGNRDSNDTRFSYQGMAGFAYNFAEIPGVEWILGYRYLGVSKPSYATGSGKASVEYSLHDLEAGLKMHF